MLGPDLIIHDMGEFEAIHSKLANQTTHHFLYFRNRIDGRGRNSADSLPWTVTYVANICPSNFKLKGVQIWTDWTVTRVCRRMVDLMKRCDYEPWKHCIVIYSLFPRIWEQAKPQLRILALLLAMPPIQVIKTVFLMFSGFLKIQALKMILNISGS